MYTDLLTRMQNAQKAKKPSFKVAFSNMNLAILEILAKNGFIASVSKKGRMPKRILEVELKYDGEEGVISGVRFLSVPSRRIYSGYEKLRRVRQGYGLALISTPKGVMTAAEAKKQKVGENYFLKFGNMSKIGAKPIMIPDGVTVTLNGNVVEIKGKGGTLKVPVLTYAKLEMKDKEIKITVEATHKQARANWGTMAAHLKNAIKGVQEPFMKMLDVQGIGYKAAMEGKNLVLNLGFTHPIKFTPPEGITIAVEKNVVKVSGIDRQMVGQTAAEIRRFKKPEPYKGKGIRYVGERVRRKEGKKVAGSTGA